MRGSRKNFRGAAVKPAKRRPAARPVKATGAPKDSRLLAKNSRRMGKRPRRVAAGKPGTVSQNRLAIVIGTAALTVLSGSGVWLAFFDRADAVPNRHQRETAIEAMIDVQAGAGRAEIGDNPPLLAILAPVKSNPADDRAPPVPVTQSKPAQTAESYAKPRLKSRIRHGRLAALGDSQNVEAANSAVAAVGGNALIAEARRHLGTNPTGRSSLWCGAFLDMVLKRTGYRGGGNLARAYARYGTRVSGPQVGAIVVLARNGGGHVGIVSGIDSKGNPVVISGNHNRRVAESTYPRGRMIAYVVPNG